MALCSVHGKNRTEENLVADRKGGMRCSPDSQCQMSGGGGGGGMKRSASAMNPQMMQQMMMMMMMGGEGPMKKMKKSGGQVCTTHFKERSLQSMTDDGQGGYCCIDGEECKIGASGEDLRDQFCSVHKKKRSEKCLIDRKGKKGGKQCAPGMECQVSEHGPSEQVVCSVHKKNRSMDSCIENNRGGYKCAPGFTCQMGAGDGGSNVSKTSPMMGNGNMMANMMAMAMAGKAAGKGW